VRESEIGESEGFMIVKTDQAEGVVSFASASTVLCFQLSGISFFSNKLFCFSHS
jgi:hypothetical protein